MRPLRLLALAGTLAAGALPAQPTDAGGTAGRLAEAQRIRQTRRASSRYDEIFQRYAKRYFSAAFDWRWFKAQGMAESNLDSQATSWVGARGIMQLMPATYQQIQSREAGFGTIDDPEWNIAAGIKHDRMLWRLWDGQPTTEDRMNFMFGSYNAGQGTIGRAVRSAREVATEQPTWTHVEQVAPQVPRWRYRETLGYVRKIRTNYVMLRR